MELNKARIEKLAVTIYNGIGKELSKCEDNYQVNSVEFTIALAQAAKGALLSGLEATKALEQMSATKWINAFGNMMFFDIDKNIEIAKGTK